MPQNIQFQEKTKEAIVEWVTEHLTTIRNTRLAFIPKWTRWRRMYEAKPRVQQKNFPWPGASNVYVPITATGVDAIHANMMNRLFSFDRAWAIEAYRPKEAIGLNLETSQPITDKDIAEALGRYLNMEGEQQGMLNVYEPLSEGILGCIKLGTSVTFAPYLARNEYDYSVDPATGQILEPQLIQEWTGVFPTQLPLEDFETLPQYAKLYGPWGSPFVGHRYWLRASELEERRDEYTQDAVNKILESPGGEDETLKEEQDRLEENGQAFTDLRKDDYQMHDVHARVPLKHNGRFREVRLYLTIHEPTNTLARIRPWPDERPPYIPMRYLMREGRFYGIGVPEMSESIQAGVNTNFNQAVDNVTVANVRCIKLKRGAPGVNAAVRNLYPGKRIQLNSMDDMEDFAMGEVYPSVFQIGLLLRDMHERRIGISDFNLGRESEVLGRASTATTTMALLNESNRRFDLYSKDIRRAVADLGMHILLTLQRHKPVDRIYTYLGQDGELVERAFALPEGINLKQKFRVLAAASAAQSNKEIARQNSTVVINLIRSFAQDTMQLAMLMVNDQVPEQLKKLAIELGNLAERAYTRLLQDYEMEDLTGLLPQLERLNAGVPTNGPAQPQNGAGIPGLGAPGGLLASGAPELPAGDAGGGFTGG